MIGILAIWNVVAHVLFPDGFVAGIVAAAGVALVVMIALRAGAGIERLGLARDHVGGGLGLGAMVAGVIVAVVAAAAAVAASREFSADDRFVCLATSEVLTQALVRIPIVTALTEKIAFNGVLLGMLLMWTSPLRALVVSSALFGLWHVLPAIAALETNPAGDLATGWAATAVGVAGQVIVTGAAGAGLAWLRFRGASVAAPTVAHWAVNGAAYIAELRS